MILRSKSRGPYDENALLRSRGSARGPLESSLWKPQAVTCTFEHDLVAKFAGHQPRDIMVTRSGIVLAYSTYIATIDYCAPLEQQQTMMADTHIAEYFFFPLFKRKRSGSLSIYSRTSLTLVLDMLRTDTTALETLTRFPPFSEPQQQSTSAEAPMRQGLCDLFRSSAAAGSAITTDGHENTSAGSVEEATLRHRASELSNASAGTGTSRWRWPLRRMNTNASNLAVPDDAVDTGDFEVSRRAELDKFIDELDRTFLTVDDRKMLRKIERLYHTTIRQRLPESSLSSEEADRANSSWTALATAKQGGLPASPSSRTTTDVLSASSANLPALRLRGGGRRTTLPSPPPRMQLPDDARIDATAWWLAGGRESRHGRLPTIGELRVRKEVEQANRSKVGFFGTLLGIRSVGRVALKGEEVAKAEEVVNGLWARMSNWVIMVMRLWAQKLRAKLQVCTAALDHVEAVAQTRITDQNGRSSGVTAAPKAKLLVLDMITKRWKHQQSHQRAERKLSRLRSGQVLEPSEP